ncbi:MULTISPECIES: hypothetical protein [unclassified Streptomyces]|uniref:hypothetical protein n=1 Tax=unclassified Streptomyces TaxID=2593676 RepID=UPI00287774EA|nr:hypothetical protein [Streptomyces sp. BB1-1-1]WND33286.1 hypothetical protein RI578_02845 [Streptomyces sp. BB1-1-1]
MRKSSWAAVAALALSVLSAAPAEAAVSRAVHLPVDVTATECIQGGGVIIISVDGSGTGSFTKRCQGGTHDGETVT